MKNGKGKLKMMNEKEIAKYDAIVEYGIATVEELNLVRNLMAGEWDTLLNDIIFVRTGYRTLEQYIECELGTDED